MSNALLVLNAGSSSLKASLFRLESGKDNLPLHCRALAERLGGEGQLTLTAADGTALRRLPLPTPSRHADAVALLMGWIEELYPDLTIRAIGHRVVHGGDLYTGPTLLDEQTLKTLRSFIPLAPLHQPHNLQAPEFLHDHAPGIPQVACFDTSFHRTMPAVAEQFALPRQWSAKGIKRYGFHGLSYEYIAETLPDYVDLPPQSRVIVAHLGHGVSMAALKDLKSIATTMGFTALDGLPMGKRCGNIDPGVLLHLMMSEGLRVEEVNDILYKQSGLLGVSGLSDDVRDLLASPSPHAAEAIDLLVYRIVREIGALAACLEGLDAIVFTAGVGEHAAPIRHAVCEKLKWMGLDFDPVANKTHGPCLTTKESRISAWVIPTN